MSKTHWKKLTNPNYLGTYALDPGKDLIVTIKDVTSEMVFNPSKGEEEQCTVLQFKEDVKPMIANPTNQKQIQRLYGTPYIEDWIGKKIQLFIKDGIKAFGEITTGLRIRPKVPKTTKDELTPDHDRWPGAVESLARDETTIKTIRKHFKLDAEMKELLLEDVQDFIESQQEKQPA